VMRALHALGGAHGLELLELDICVRPVQGNGDGEEKEAIPVIANGVAIRAVS